MKSGSALTALILSLLLLAAGCGKKEPAQKTTVSTAQTLNVPLARATLGSREEFYEATGTVKAKTTTGVSANMAGRIVSFPVSEGDTVSRGQTLVEIDSRESRAQLEKAQAGLREASASLVEIDRAVEAAGAGVRTAEANRQLAEKTFARFKELYERKSASGQEFDEAQARLRAATSELERARADVRTILSRKQQIGARIEQAKADISSTRIYESYSRIAAPVSGIVVKKFVESGAIASPGAPLLSIEDNSQYRLEAAVDESHSKLMQVGRRVNVRIDALGGGEFFGVVSEILPSTDAASRTFIVKIDIPPNPFLKSGLYGVARFPIEAVPAILIPQTALLQRGQLTGVYVVAADGTAQFRILTTGKTADGLVEVLSGLAEGDEFVSAEASRVGEGAKVK